VKGFVNDDHLEEVDSVRVPVGIEIRATQIHSAIGWAVKTVYLDRSSESKRVFAAKFLVLVNQHEEIHVGLARAVVLARNVGVWSTKRGCGTGGDGRTGSNRNNLQGSLNFSKCWNQDYVHN